MESFGAITDDSWGSGVYLMPAGHKTGIVVIHQLPATADTLWLRILGKQKVQQRAIEEINQLALDSPYRQNALELLSDLRVVLERNKNRDNQDKELLMSLKTSQPYLDHIAEITQQSIKQGLEQGLEQGRTVGEKALVLKLLNRKLGSLSIDLTAKINDLSLDLIEALVEDLLDFETVEDLERWLDHWR